jgi:Cof subfamily protein (haloacid dehalogenase superfamily)
MYNKKIDIIKKKGMQMNKKLIFFDIDGTLLASNGKIPDSTKESIRKLQEAGHEVAIATGRAPFMFQDIRQELNIHSYVSFNGTYAIFQGEVVYNKPISLDIMKELYQFSRQQNHPLVYMGLEKLMATEENHPFIIQGMNWLHSTYPDVDPQFYRKHPIYQIEVYCGEEDEHLYDRFLELRKIRWFEKGLDLLVKGSSKQTGMEKIMERLHFKPEDVVAFGDGTNDVEMIQFAGVGVAMGNAHPDLKEVAKYVTKSVDEEGIAHAVRELSLI